MPIALELLDFEVQRNEGSDSPAGFKSTVRVTDREGGSATGQCWMNNPFNYPGRWWSTWTGLTYKMSQASWNPENLEQSTIQILRDPGWLLKWIGSLPDLRRHFHAVLREEIPAAERRPARRRRPGNRSFSCAGRRRKLSTARRAWSKETA